MDTHGYTLLKVLANKFHPKNVQAFLRYLPQEEAATINEIAVDAIDPSFAWRTAADWLENMHSSWILPTLQEFPKELQQFIVDSLQGEQAIELRSLLNLKSGNQPLCSVVRRFWQAQLVDKLGLKEVVPLELVPNGQFKCLTTWRQDQLLTLIDYLSMHDLKRTIRHIVDRRRLQGIYNCLDKGRIDFLKECMHRKEQLSVSELSLDGWRGSQEEFTTILRKRGLLRFSKALVEQPPSLMWHLSHILDRDTSTLMMSSYSEKTAPEVVRILAQQLQAAIDYLLGTGRRG